jgi:hypothetical protein
MDSLQNPRMNILASRNNPVVFSKCAAEPKISCFASSISDDAASFFHQDLAWGMILEIKNIKD